MSYTLVHVTRGTKFLYHIKVLLNSLDGTRRRLFETYPFEAFPQDFLDAEFDTEEFPEQFKYFTEFADNYGKHYDSELATKYKNGASMLLFKTTRPKLSLAFINTVFEELVHDLRFLHIQTRKHYDEYFKFIETDMGINELKPNISEIYVEILRMSFRYGLMLRFKFLSLLRAGFNYKVKRAETYVSILEMIVDSANDAIGIMLTEFGAPESNPLRMPLNFKQLYVRNDIYEKDKPIAWHIVHKLDRHNAWRICTVYEHDNDARINDVKHVPENIDKPDIETDKPKQRIFDKVDFVFSYGIPFKNIEDDGTVKEWTQKLPV